MEKVKDYKNAELLNQSHEEFLKSIKPTFKVRNDFIARLEVALMYLNQQHSEIRHSEAYRKSNIKTFDGALLIDQEAFLKKDIFYLPPISDFQANARIFPSLNVKSLHIGKDMVQLQKFRLLSLKEKRHLDKRFRDIIDCRFGYYDHKKNKWFLSQSGYGLINKENTNVLWPTSTKAGYYLNDSEVKNWVDKNRDIMVDKIQSVNMAFQIALSHFYEWHCHIREKKDSVSFSVPIHPSSSKEVFMLRNLPEGKTRRRAICNYVKEHFRTVKNVKGEDVQILIKKHLRGDLKFNWRGLEVSVKPSEYDLKRFSNQKKTKEVKRMFKES